MVRPCAAMTCFEKEIEMRRSVCCPVLMSLCAMTAVLVGCNDDAGPAAATKRGPVTEASGSPASTMVLDEVAAAHARDAAGTAGWTLVNPEALARIPPVRRDLSGLHPHEALDAIARDAGLRAYIANRKVHFVPGEPYVALSDGDAMDILIVAEPVESILRQLATASAQTLDIPPGLPLQRGVSLNFAKVPLRTTLQVLADETNTRITIDAGVIRVRPRATGTP